MLKGTTKRRGPKLTSQAERYHHGDLRAELIRAADEILLHEGIEGFSLREAARRAGVSPAAPSHHFGSSAGLLSEVAILGFDELTRHLEVDEHFGTPAQRLRHQALGYVRFALTFPGRFQLMFRHDLLSKDYGPLQDAGKHAMDQLEKTIRALRSVPAGHPLDAESGAALLNAWSVVHGFSYLALDGKLAHMYSNASSEYLLTKVLPGVLREQWPDT